MLLPTVVGAPLLYAANNDNNVSIDMFAHSLSLSHQSRVCTYNLSEQHGHDLGLLLGERLGESEAHRELVAFAPLGAAVDALRLGRVLLVLARALVELPRHEELLAVELREVVGLEQRHVEVDHGRLRLGSECLAHKVKVLKVAGRRLAALVLGRHDRHAGVLGERYRGVALDLLGGLDWRLDALVQQVVPVDAREERVLLDLLEPALAATKATRHVLDQ